MAMDQDTLLHRETLFVIFTTESNPIILPFFTQSISSSSFCGHMPLTKDTKFAFIIHFNELLAASVWEKDVQLHLEAADHLQGISKKKNPNKVDFWSRW